MPIVASSSGANYDGTWIVNQSTAAAPVTQPTGLNVGIVGTYNWGPVSKPVLCSSPKAAYRQFGDTIGTGLTGIIESVPVYANGARNVYHVRVTDGTDAAATVSLMDTEATPASAIVGTAVYTGSKGNQIKITIAAASNGTATLNDVTVALGSQVDAYRNVSVDPSVNGNLITKSANSTIMSFTAPTTAPTAYPGLALGTFSATTGTDGATTLAATDYVGTISPRTGLYSFGILTGVNRVAEAFLAGQSDSAAATSAFTWGQEHNVFIHMSIPVSTQPSALAAITQVIDQQFGGYAYIWQKVTDPFTGQNVLVSPAAFAVGVAGSGYAWDSIENVPIQGSQGAEIDLVPEDDYATIQGAQVNAIGPIEAGGTGFATGFNLSQNSNENQITDTLTQIYIANGELQALGWSGGKLMNNSWQTNVLASLSMFLDGLVALGVVGDTAGAQQPYLLDTSGNTSTNLSAGTYEIQQTVLLIAHSRKIIITSQVGRSGTTVKIQSAA